MSEDHALSMHKAGAFDDYMHLTTFTKRRHCEDRSIGRTEIRSARNRPGNWMTLRNAPMSSGFFLERIK